MQRRRCRGISRGERDKATARINLGLRRLGMQFSTRDKKRWRTSSICFRVIIHGGRMRFDIRQLLRV